MIKVNSGKSKTIDFDISFEAGASEDIQEIRFLIEGISGYSIMIPATLNKNSISVDLPALDIQAKTKKCSLEVISKDNTFSTIWTDSIKFEKGLNIKVEQKETTKTPILEVKEKNIKKRNTSESKNKAKKVASNETRTLFRTIRLDEQSFNEVVNSGKFSMKPQPNMKLSFYPESSMLVNDLENINYGICISTFVPENSIISENTLKIIVDTSYLKPISESNVLYLINQGNLQEFTRL